MCWRVWYVYKCRHDSTTTYKCCKCPNGDTYCSEAESPKMCQLEEACHTCSFTPESLAKILAIDLHLRGDGLVRPLETNFIANRLIRTRRRTPLGAVPRRQT